MARIAFLSTRINGSDGVSLEIKKWAAILEQLGHTIYYCAGELGEQENQVLIPEMHFNHPGIQHVSKLAFGIKQTSFEINSTMSSYAELIKQNMKFCLKREKIDLIIAENILTIPMNLPLGMALTELHKEIQIPVLAHHHDFYWERERFLQNKIPDILDAYFPPDLPGIKHIVINTIAKQTLQARTGIDAEVIPNIFDFNRNVYESNMSREEVRAKMGVLPDEIMILQPTRIVPRKGIELAIELVAELQNSAINKRLDGRRVKLVISHPSGDEGNTYLEKLRRQAREADVQLIQADALFDEQITGVDAMSIWEAYRAADLVTYPSYIEGFGNALLEAIYFKLPVVINQYPVYQQDIKPLGFDLIEIEDKITADTVEQVLTLLNNAERVQEMVDTNFEIARTHYSYEAIAPILDTMVGSV